MTDEQRQNIMMWFKPKPDPEQVALAAKRAACKHDGRFHFTGSNTARPLCGTCNDCGAEVMLDDILNTYVRKLDAILDKNGVR